MVNKIYNKKAEDLLVELPAFFIDLTITSPPYNVNLGNNKYNKNEYDIHDDNMDHNEYISWLKSIFELVYLKTKSGGRCIINIGDGLNGKISTHSDIIQMMQSIGWLNYTIIIWDKKSTSNRTAWGSWMSPSSPSFPRCFEYILVFARDSYKLQEKGKSDLTRNEFIKWTLGTWSFPGETKKIKHPAPFPVELPMRCMKMFSYQNSVVFDPFMGSGSTAIAAIETNRNFIGAEISPEYCEIANNRINNYIRKIKKND